MDTELQWFAVYGTVRNPNGDYQIFNAIKQCGHITDARLMLLRDYNENYAKLGFTNFEIIAAQEVDKRYTLTSNGLPDFNR